MSKRPRTFSSTPSSSQQRNTTKPSPTPDPPVALVKLLQTDSTVLEYFSALQANIDYDLQVWKNEALEGRKEINRLSKLLTKCGNSSSTFTLSNSEVAKEESQTVRKESTNIRGLEKRNAPTLQKVSSSKSLKRRDDTEEQKKPIGNLKDSEILSDDSDSDGFLKELCEEFDSSPVSKSVSLKKKEVTVNVPVINDSCHLKKQMSDDWFSSLLENLGQCLRKLGVTLMKEKPIETTEPDIVPTHSKTQNQSFLATEKTTTKSTSLMSCSDLEICTDIYRALRLSIRSPLQPNLYKNCKNNRHPFSSLNFYPCYLEVGDAVHPAADCIKLICRLLTILQLCSQSYFGDNSNFNNYLRKSLGKEYDLAIVVKERNLATMIMTSLEGEICRYWSISDKLHNFENCVGVPMYVDDSSPLVLDTDQGKGGVSISYSIMQGRLLQLVERASIARIISSIHQSNRDYQRAASIVINYMLQYTPIIGKDKYIYGSCMSLCIVEALLATSWSTSNTNDKKKKEAYENSWFGYFLHQLDLMTGQSEFSAGTLLGEALAVALAVSVFIYRQRLSSDDLKLRGLSIIELAAYDRISETESSWLFNHSFNKDYQETVSSKLTEIVDFVHGEKEVVESTTALLSIPLMFYMLLSGDLPKICYILNDLISKWASLGARGLQALFADYLYSCCKAYTIVEEKCMVMQSFIEDRSSPTESIQQLLERYALESIKKDSACYLYTVKCSIILSDGYLAIKTIDSLLRHLLKPDNMVTLPASFIQQIQEIGLQYPLVRVINLRRRPDRLRAFFNQARHEELLVILGASPLSYDKSTDESALLCGKHAYDGQGSHLEFEKTAMQFLGTNLKLSSYVSTHWRPNDLRAFDTYARSDDAQVRMSPSERACALSHISSWIGVERSMEESSSSSPINVIKYRLLQLYRAAGFASGPALLSENDKIQACPVFLIMEDDAILVDRFTDRLQALLNELPKDFHFCSLGYGRPTTAPLLKYSSQLGIPTCIWYLTGYILSLDGVKFLLQNLPCVGPIDSWIGLKMTANWDNIYGRRVGLGVNKKAVVDMLPPRKDLVKILRFRAFAALTPLCSQKLTSSSGDSWRDRDTDITYSGKS